MERKETHHIFPLSKWTWPLLAIFLLLTGACTSAGKPGPQTSSAARHQADQGLAACRIALAPIGGTSQIDQEISRLQKQLIGSADPVDGWERLGWLLVSKARLDYDPGFYKLAEQCALCLESKRPRSAAALLLRGHILHSMHRFKEAEDMARRLVEQRGISYDFGLLGDALMEQGKLEQAISSYQKMVDLKPDIHAYSRIAHLRWLKGDLGGATALIRMAARAGTIRDPESVAWAYTRLSLYELQGGDFEAARQASDLALDYHPDYAPALLAQGRILLAQGHATQSAEALSRAARLNPLPEYQWWLAEALQESEQSSQAQAIEQRLMRPGRVDDPRTLSLFLATRGKALPAALRLARRDLEGRQDVLSLDALAWVLQATGETGEASSLMTQALAEGTQDARLFFHAAIIFARAGKTQEAAHWLEKARRIQHMLLPSERSLLATSFEISAGDTHSVASRLSTMRKGG